LLCEQLRNVAFSLPPYGSPKSLEVGTVAPANLEIYAFPLVYVAEEPLGLCTTRYSRRNDQ
jgi:hypothetical protein